MGYLKIHCHQCGGTWDVYSRDNWTADTARQCPHCFMSIDSQTWAKQIIPAFALMDDANRELAKDHSGYHTPLFDVSYTAGKTAER